MLVRGCAGGELRHSLAERTKALAAKCHALRSPAREQRSVERRRPRNRKSQTRWYVKTLGNVKVTGDMRSFTLGAFLLQ
ncbi:hypothetical protein KGM_211137 [Danaus plexippus plexippus]|uniref:Uncharacterized protein n=1 Tax=Danaus plexippus plexippus TaxID=278856 RepID=A0A212EJA9_DANPL|nr:hypothetical protein KGM_211137 [Danaus plexippus plexippus]